MPFPPNYRQDRNNRARNKARKALEKQAKREEKSNLRHRDQQNEPAPEGESAEQKVE